MPFSPTQQRLFEKSLEEAEAMLEERREQQAVISGEIRDLRKLVAGLRATLGLAPAEDSGNDLLSMPSLQGLTALTTGSRAAQIATAAALLSRTYSSNRRVIEAAEVEPELSTADRVVMILDERGEPMTTQEIFGEFENRDWVDPEWGFPEGTVSQATRRAAKAQRIVRLDRKHYGSVALATSSLMAPDGVDPADLEAEGGTDDA